MSEEASDGEDRPKKRGRPRVNAKDGVKGFTDAEIRRFVKSFRKFSSPLHRLEAVAGDAELLEKPLSDLKKLGELILQRCQEALLSQKSGIKDSLLVDKVTFLKSFLNLRFFYVFHLFDIECIDFW